MEISGDQNSCPCIWIKSEPESSVKYEETDKPVPQYSNTQMDYFPRKSTPNANAGKLVLKPQNILDLEESGSHKRHRCHFCERTFVNASTLQTHVKLHYEETPFKCPYCVKAFKLDFYLQTHIRVHTGEKPYKCTICDSKFSQKSTLNQHMKLHSNKRPFKCPDCPAAFKLKTYLNNHLKGHVNSFSPRGCVVWPELSSGDEFSDQENEGLEDEKPACKSVPVSSIWEVAEVSDYFSSPETVIKTERMDYDDRFESKEVTKISHRSPNSNTKTMSAEKQPVANSSDFMSSPEMAIKTERRDNDDHFQSEDFTEIPHGSPNFDTNTVTADKQSISETLDFMSPLETAIKTKQINNDYHLQFEKFIEITHSSPNSDTDTVMADKQPAAKILDFMSSPETAIRTEQIDNDHYFQFVEFPEITHGSPNFDTDTVTADKQLLSAVLSAFHFSKSLSQETQNVKDALDSTSSDVSTPDFNVTSSQNPEVFKIFDAISVPGSGSMNGDLSSFETSRTQKSCAVLPENKEPRALKTQSTLSSSLTSSTVKPSSRKLPQTATQLPSTAFPEKPLPKKRSATQSSSSTVITSALDEEQSCAVLPENKEPAALKTQSTQRSQSSSPTSSTVKPLSRKLPQTATQLPSTASAEKPLPKKRSATRSSNSAVITSSLDEEQSRSVLSENKEPACLKTQSTQSSSPTASTVKPSSRKSPRTAIQLPSTVSAEKPLRKTRSTTRNSSSTAITSTLDEEQSRAVLMENKKPAALKSQSTSAEKLPPKTRSATQSISSALDGEQSSAVVSQNKKRAALKTQSTQNLSPTASTVKPPSRKSPRTATQLPSTASAEKPLTKTRSTTRSSNSTVFTSTLDEEAPTLKKQKVTAKTDEIIHAKSFVRRRI